MNKTLLTALLVPAALFAQRGGRGGAAVPAGAQRDSLVLLKPADAQFLVSTAKIEPWHLVDVFGSLAIFVYAFSKIGRSPSGHCSVKRV